MALLAGYSSKGPDLSRNTALAGQTVYSGGMNVTYDENGYAISASNPNHTINAGTDRSIWAPSIEAVQRTTDRSKYGGSDYDKQHFTTKQLETADLLRSQAQQGLISWDEANAGVEGIRAGYGYSGGADGSQYNKLGYTIFNPSDVSTQPLSQSFQAQPSIGWTTQQNQWNDDYYASGGKSSSPFSNSVLMLYEPQEGGSGGTFPSGYTPGSYAGFGAGYGYGYGDDGLLGQYLGLYGADGPYAQSLSQQRAANDAAVQMAIGRLEGQKKETNDAYSDYYRQAYVDWMDAQKNINQRLAAQGVTGGAAESTLLGMSTAYSDALRQAEQKRIGALGDLDRAITEARLNGDIQNARTTAESVREQTAGYANALRYLMNRYDTFAARQQAYDREDAQRAEAYAAQEAQRQTQQEQAARTLAWQLVQGMLAQGNMPDDETLAAAGITREQAAALLPPAAEQPAYTPTFTQSQVYDALKRGLLTGNMLRDYNWYVYGDPDYGGGSTGGYVGGTGSYSSGGGKSSKSTVSGSTNSNVAGMNESSFNQEARTIMQYMSQGMVQKAQERLAMIWGQLSQTQQEQLAAALAKNGYMQ